MKQTPKSSTNKELAKMIETIKDAQKNGQKSVVVFTTSRENHKENITYGVVSVNDLKPKFLEAYKHLLCTYNLDTRLVDASTCSVEWIVKL